MRTSASEEIAAFHAAQNEGEREYWTRQIIIRRLRAHAERNGELFRWEQCRFRNGLLMVAGLTLAGGAVAVKLWL